MPAHLLVYAGTSYDKDKLVKVPVNKGDDSSFIELKSPYAVDGVIRLAIRIKGFKDVKESGGNSGESTNSLEDREDTGIIDEAVVDLQNEEEDNSENNPKTLSFLNESPSRSSSRNSSRSSSSSSTSSNASSKSSRLRRLLKPKSRSNSPSISSSSSSQLPSDSPYFDQENHVSDQLSIQFSVRFKTPINGDDLLFGNDFDEPIRDILPYGFSLGYKVFKWYIDPSVEGDPMADKPYLYGRALTSINTIEENEDTEIPWAGFVNTDRFINEGTGTPNRLKEITSSERMAYFRDKAKRQSFEFVANNLYTFDFFTPYLTLGDSFGVQLPGFKFDVGKYCGGQPLRYVLKNLLDDSIYLVIVFSLVSD